MLRLHLQVLLRPFAGGRDASDAHCGVEVRPRAISDSMHAMMGSRNPQLARAARDAKEPMAVLRALEGVCFVLLAILAKDWLSD